MARWLCTSLVLLLVAHVSPCFGTSHASVLADGSARAAPSVHFLEPVNDGSWVYGDSVRVTVRAQNFNVPQHGRICVAASWGVAADGTGDWSCLGNAPGGVLTTTVAGASNATIGPHTIVAHLMDSNGDLLSIGASRAVFVPFHHRLVKPGEWRDMQNAFEGSLDWDSLPMDDKYALSFVSPTHFWYYTRKQRFVKIIQPRNGSAVQADAESMTGSITLRLKFTDPRVVGEMGPEVCVTVDHTYQSCSRETDELTIPHLPVGRHRLSVQLRADKGVYYGRSHVVEVLVTDPNDPRETREIMASEAPPRNDIVVTLADLLKASECDRLVETGHAVGWTPLDAVEGPLTELDRNAPRAIEHVSVSFLNSNALFNSNLGPRRQKASTTLDRAKQLALQLVGLESKCRGRIDDCIETDVHVYSYSVQQWYPQHYEHREAECYRAQLRRPVASRLAGEDEACFARVADEDPRYYTVEFYLTSLTKGAGGATVFPVLDVAVQPTKGSVAAWRECVPTKLTGAALEAAQRRSEPTTVCVPEQRTVHVGAPVDWEGFTKYVLKVHILFNSVTFPQ